MFRQLRLKMTLINAGVTALLFILLILGVTALLRYNAQQTTSFFFRKITEAVVEQNMHDFPPRHDAKENSNDKNKHDDAKADEHPPEIFPMPRLNFFFVRVDNDGQILHQSSYVTISDETLQALARFITVSEKAADDITFASTPFSYLRTPLSTGDTLIVINDRTQLGEVLADVTYNLVVVGILCTLLSLLISSYLAKHAIRPIQYATEQQKKFVSNASHELRTPITIIQANLDIINGSPPGDSIDNNRKWIDNIQDETSRMTELINALLFLARADANRQLLEKEYFDLSEVSHKSLDAFQLLAQERGIVLACNAATKVQALGDPARIRQLLTILIDNAMHHTSTGGSITVRCYPAGDTVVLSVSDTGDGIAEEDLPRIFDRFYQSDSSRNQSGAGLGLSMAQWIVSQHKGSIDVKSQLGKGTKFIISLPNSD